MIDFLIGLWAIGMINLIGFIMLISFVGTMIYIIDKGYKKYERKDDK